MHRPLELGAGGKCLEAAPRGQNRVAGRHEDALGELQERFLIFHHQDGLGAPGRWAGRSRRAGDELAQRCGAGKEDFEGGPGAGLAPHGDVARELLQDAIQRREPEASALLAALGGEEGFEDAREGGAIHAHAGIAHREPHEVARLQVRMSHGLLGAQPMVRGGDGQRPAVGHRIAGVEREVHEHLLQLHAIAFHPGEVRREREHHIRRNPRQGIELVARRCGGALEAEQAVLSVDERHLVKRRFVELGVAPTPITVADFVDPAR